MDRISYLLVVNLLPVLFSEVRCDPFQFCNSLLMHGMDWLDLFSLILRYSVDVSSVACHTLYKKLMVDVRQLHDLIQNITEEEPAVSSVSLSELYYSNSFWRVIVNGVEFGV